MTPDLVKRLEARAKDDEDAGSEPTTSMLLREAALAISTIESALAETNSRLGQRGLDENQLISNRDEQIVSAFHKWANNPAAWDIDLESRTIRRLREIAEIINASAFARGELSGIERAAKVLENRQDAFEAWMATGNYPETTDIALKKLPDGQYKSQLTFAAWQGWQGACNILQIALAPTAASATEQASGCEIEVTDEMLIALLKLSKADAEKFRAGEYGHLADKWRGRFEAALAAAPPRPHGEST